MTTKPKVLISDSLSPAAVKIFEERGVDVDVKKGLKPEELCAIIGEYDGLAIRSATKVTKDVLVAATRLKVVGRAGIGVDNVDIPGATARGVLVMNTPFGNSITTAEHTLAMIFALARQIPAANASTQAGKWEKNRFMGAELYGKTLGTIGCGNIGSIVADRAIGLKMKVIAYDPFLAPERATQLGVDKVELDDLLARADIITLHTPLTDATRNILDAKAFAKCKKGVRIINCARGGLVNEADLKAALESGQVAGAALDVFTTEPAKENALFGMENVICTPHLGASTAEAQENVALQVAEQMSDYLTRGTIANAINTPSVSAEDAVLLKPYMRLAEVLGTYCSQCVDATVTDISIGFEGEASALNVKPLVALTVAHTLGPLMSSVNAVNALTVAKERGIQVSERKQEDSSRYRTLMRLTVRTSRSTYVIEGALIGGAPRIVSLGDFSIEVEPAPHMLYLRSADRPGVIGRFATILGEHKVNIANFNMGRNAPGDKNLALVAVDTPVDDALLAKMHELDGVQKVRRINFSPSVTG
ncbi:MAG: phosphoglycerate dehydrogenase [Alphaproteobacteria bacterium]|nr:phosphoglycerate dehydrogenase [Alphaproteobacteria bacterium]